MACVRKLEQSSTRKLALKLDAKAWHKSSVEGLGGAKKMVGDKGLEPLTSPV
jgi:hypothetical protein